METKELQEEKKSSESEKRTERHVTVSFLASLLLIGILVLVYALYQKKEHDARRDLGGGTKVSQTLQEKLADQSKRKKFASYEELQTFVEQNSQENNYGLRNGGEWAESGLPERAVFNSPMENVAPDSNMTKVQTGGVDFSQTNIQVSGVDEADIVKTDGTYIYTLSQKTLAIAKAYPGEEAQLETRIEFESQPQDIYLQDDRLVVFGMDQEIFNREYAQRFRRRSAYTFFKIFDVSDKKNPRLIRDFDFEGSYLNSRMIGEHVYFLTSTHTQYYADEVSVPRILDFGKELYDVKNSTVCANCPPVYYFDIPYETMNLVNIAAINIFEEKEMPKNQVYLLNQGQNFYASKDNLYLTYTKYVSEYELFAAVAREVIFPYLGQADQERVREIEAVDAAILSDQEKLEKISFIVMRYLKAQSLEDGRRIEQEIRQKMEEKYADISKELEKTVIHKIAIEKDNIEYKNFGEVTGTVLNQFSMDEDGGYFRIATTKNRSFSFPRHFKFLEEVPAIDRVMLLEAENQSYSNIYVLDENLQVVGRAEELAPGERIYAVRFMQNRAYLVTFQQVDPLFVIDLKDPKKPVVLGELKIPGFSNYLHPYDENTLIGIGKQTEERGSGVTVKGVKLSLFDVRDVRNPREIDAFEMGGSGSDSLALHDHKAFLFSKEKNLLAIPVNLLDYQDNSAEKFNGVAVFGVNPEGFTLKGRITHEEKTESMSGGFDSYGLGIKRSLYIGENLYTISDQFLKINKLENLDSLRTVLLRSEDDFRVIPNRESF